MPIQIRIFSSVLYAVLYTYIMAVVSLLIFKLSPCLIQQHTMKMYEEVEVQLHTLSTLTLCGSEWFASRLDTLPSRKVPPVPIGQVRGGGGCRV
jgi:hypothetical protein